MFNETNPIRTELPGLAVRGVVPLPNNEIRLDVGRGDSLKALKLLNNIRIMWCYWFRKTSSGIANGRRIKSDWCHRPHNSQYDPPKQYSPGQIAVHHQCKINSFVSTKPHFMVDVESLPSVPEFG